VAASLSEMNSAWLLWLLLGFAEAALAFDLQSDSTSLANERFLQRKSQQNTTSYFSSRRKPSRIRLKKRKGAPALQFEPRPGSRRKTNFKVSSESQTYFVT